jgi:hypothetical protein
MPALASQLDDLQRRTLSIGFGPNAYETWDIRNPMSHCSNITWNSVVVRNPDRDNATRPSITMASWRSDFEFDADHAIGAGEYFTDAYADGLLSSSDPSATRQFVEPGYHLSFTKNATANRIECSAADPWTFEFSC